MDNLSGISGSEGLKQSQDSKSQVFNAPCRVPTLSAQIFERLLRHFQRRDSQFTQAYQSEFSHAHAFLLSSLYRARKHCRSLSVLVIAT